MEEAANSENLDIVVQDAEPSETDQMTAESGCQEQPGKDTCPSNDKDQDSTLDLFSEGFMSEPKSPEVIKTVADVPVTAVEKKNLLKDGGSNQEKSVSQGFDVLVLPNSNSAGDAKEPIGQIKKTVTKVENKKEGKEKEQSSNKSCDDLWTDDDMEDSFVLKATQDLFDSEAFHTPKADKSLDRTSTPLGSKKGGRFLNLVLSKSAAVSSATATVASAGPVKTVING